jgi:hypothetical protein
MLEERAINFPIRIGSVGVARRLLAVASELAQNDFSGAERRLQDLDRDLDADSEPPAGLSLPPGQERVALSLRARIIARVLRDLATNGWAVLLEAGQVYVKAPSSRVTGAGLTQQRITEEKARARAQMAPRVAEQLDSPGTQRFIGALESLHFGAEGPRSVRSLIADGPGLAATLRVRGADAIQPYVEVADERRDPHTGMRRWDIYRYFRYFWSFPFYSTPGRTLPMLVRDGGQPNHPVCGLLCLASPVPKLGARDTALGLTPAWLEAVVLAVDCAASDDFQVRLSALEHALDERGDAALTGAAVSADLARMMRLPGDRGARSAVRALAELSRAARTARAKAARGRLVADLLGEIDGAVREIAVADLGLTHAELLRTPARHLERLRNAGEDAHSAWRGSRALGGDHARRCRRDSQDMTDGELREFTKDPLFRKKRLAQLRSLLAAWAELAPLRESASAEHLRALVTGERLGFPPLTGGARVASGLRTALQQRVSRLMSAQVADVSVCGAIPPYGPLLGGKLAALLALSGEVAELYFQQYDGQVSEIKSKMAGQAFRRPADLVALTTTSYFSVGSSQYNRVRLPENMTGIGWQYVGLSAGHGTMHFSLDTTKLIQTMLQIETGHSLINSEFGEGPSERMRKMRDGLVTLGLPADELLRHGSPRRVYVAPLGGAGKPGLAASAAPWRRRGPRVEVVSEYWRQRWLAPRLARRPEILDDLDRFTRASVLLSARAAVPRGAPALASGGE